MGNKPIKPTANYSNLRKPIIFGVAILAIIGCTIWFTTKIRLASSDQVAETVKENVSDSVKTTESAVSVQNKLKSSTQKNQNGTEDDANVDKSKGQSQISPTHRENTSRTQDISQNVSAPSDDKAMRLQEALNAEPIQGMPTILLLAEQEHYIPAYYHYARLLLQTGKASQAKQYLRMSIDAGINVSQSQQLLEVLEE